MHACMCNSLSIILSENRMLIGETGAAGKTGCACVVVMGARENGGAEGAEKEEGEEHGGGKGSVSWRAYKDWY